MLLLSVGTAQAEAPYDVQVESATFEPGDVVNVIISGVVNLTFSVRITDDAGDILAGRDAQLNETGGYVFAWTPSTEGQYNATVVYATGISISKKFLIQDKVTSRDIGELYRSLFAMEARMKELIASLDGMVKAAIALTLVSLFVTIYVGLYARKRVSPVDTEFTRFLKETVRERIERKR